MQTGEQALTAVRVSALGCSKMGGAARKGEESTGALAAGWGSEFWGGGLRLQENVRAVSSATAQSILTENS